MFRINNLIIIGGPSCSGKSFLIDKIQHSKCPRLIEQLDMGIPSSWLYVNAYDLKFINQPVVDRLVVHYDFYAQYSHEYGFNHISELIYSSERSIVLTLCVQRETLIKRHNSRILNLLHSYLCVNNGLDHYKTIRERIHHNWKKRKAYKDGVSEFLYEKWFDYFSHDFRTDHWLLNFNKSNNMIASPYKTSKDWKPHILLKK